MKSYNAPSIAVLKMLEDPILSSGFEAKDNTLGDTWD